MKAGVEGFGLELEVRDRAVYDRAVARFREARISLPSFAQLADPTKIPAIQTSSRPL